MDFYSGQNVIGWSVSEKLDGVFARLGVALFTRDWVQIQAPDSLTAGIAPCEGEIWHADGLERVQGCRQWAKDDPRWEGVEFVPHASIPSEQIRSLTHLHDFYTDVIDEGGEGVVLRGPDGVMLKMKPNQDDEAEVIGYTEGTGRNPGVGALCLLWGDVKFRLSTGLSNQDRETPPPIGAMITFSFDGLTRRGVPRCARFLRVRVAA